MSSLRPSCIPPTDRRGGRGRRRLMHFAKSCSSTLTSNLGSANCEQRKTLTNDEPPIFLKKLSSWSLVFDPIKRYNFTAKKCDWGSVCGSVWKEQSLPTPTSGQSYKAYTIVNYDSRVVPDWKIPHITTLES